LAEELLELEETSKHTPTMHLRNSRDDGIQWVLQQLDLTGDDGVEPLRAYRLALRHRNSEALAAVNELRTTLRLTPKERLATELYWPRSSTGETVDVEYVTGDVIAEPVADEVEQEAFAALAQETAAVAAAGAAFLPGQAPAQAPTGPAGRPRRKGAGKRKSDVR
jgi:hypothetical protein